MLAEVTTASKGFLAFLGDNLHQIIANTGFANVTSGHLIMIGVGLFFLYLAISRNFEPMLLVPIGFGILVGNIPFSPGMEIGILKGHFEEARRAVDSYPFDVIIGSFHCTRNDDMYRYDFAHADGPAELVDFYTYMYECLKEFQDFDIAGHFSILDRYIGTLYDYGAVEDQIDEILKLLINNGKAVIVISHDRKFVDNITTRTIEVTMGRIYDYKVNYSQYLQLRKERREQQQKAYDEQQKFIAETEAFIERFKGTYSKTLQVQSRVKMLEKLELLEVDEEDTSALRLKFPPSPRSGSYPVTMEGVGKTYGDHVVFRNANLTIERGDKVAFVGKNGEGKSTLVKCIMNEIDHDGTLTLGHNVQIGYFAQNQASLMDENLTVFQTIDDVAKGEIRNKIRDLLGAFMFGGPEESMKKVKVLSGGERTRLAMIKLLLEPVNLLILDEPTNHLDMKTKDILKQALMDFDGTLIVVSHDRDFLDGLVTKVYEFGNKKVTEHLCGIYEFLEKKKMDSLQELEKK